DVDRVDVPVVGPVDGADHHDVGRYRPVGLRAGVVRLALDDPLELAGRAAAVAASGVPVVALLVVGHDAVAAHRAGGELRALQVVAVDIAVVLVVDAVVADLGPRPAHPSRAELVAGIPRPAVRGVVAGDEAEPHAREPRVEAGRAGGAVGGGEAAELGAVAL